MNLRRTLQLWVFVILAVGFTYALKKKSGAPSDSTLRIFAYSSFTSSWGPGPKLIEEFEKECQCHVELVDAGDSALLLKTIQLRKSDTPDVIIGIDPFLVDEALATFAWRDLSSITLPPEAPLTSNSFLVPFDWAPMAFAYKTTTLERPPENLEDLLHPRFKKSIALQDPRTSTPGLQFLRWVMATQKENAEAYLKKLKPNVHSVSPGWSAAYGLFKKNQAKLVFTYLTSPIYHWVEEKDETYKTLVFDEGHVSQIELMGIPDRCHSCQLAENFVRFMLSEKSQKVLMNTNYMFPLDSKLTKGTPFERLPMVQTIQHAPEFRKEEALQIWKKVF